MSVGRDELHRTLKLSLRDRGILGRYFLIRSVVDAVARELLPVPRPIAAESAVTVIDQQRSRNGRRCSGIGGLIFRCLLHDITTTAAASRLGAYDPGPARRPWQQADPG